jgi:circadian clock protein KaiC
MIGGGVEFGTSLLIAGQAGSGKSTVASLLGLVAAERGVPTAMFLFEERAEVLRARSAGVGLDLARHEDSGAMRLQHVDPAEVSSGEFAAVALGAVDAGVRVVVIDSLNGYLEAQPGDTHVMSHMHALIQALTQRGVLVILTLAQSGLLGEPPETGVDTSFLADAVLLLRQYEAGADIRRSIAMLKKRQGEHDRRFQELVIAPGTVEVRPMSEDAMQRTRGAARLGDA